MSHSRPAMLMTLGNGVAVDPTKVIATRIATGGFLQVRVDGVWVDAWAYTGRPEALIEDLNQQRGIAGAAVVR